MTTADYITDDARGESFHLMLGDACERLAEIGTNTVDMSVCSPPFASLYTYSPSARDLGNCADRGEFLAHYSFIIREQLRVTKPGRIACVHVAQVPTTKSGHGVIGLTDFRGDVIRAFIDAGWILHGEITVDKDPQVQALRTKAQALMFTTLRRDSAMTRPALADYVLLFRKPGDNPTPIRGDVDNDTWIQWARPIWPGCSDAEALEAMEELGLILPRPAWYDIRESNTLNARAGREQADERHICPLQLDLIERCVRLWSNRGELVLSPFAGIGSEGYVAIEHGRRFAGIELKPSYWRAAVGNLTEAESRASAPALFEVAS